VSQPDRDLVLQEEAYDAPPVRGLVAEVQQEYVGRYGGPDETPVDAAEFVAPLGRFVVGYVRGDAVAMGGVRLLDAETAEVKRMYVAPRVRGRGLSRIVLARLEELARDIGARRVVLETGSKQPEAMSLYETSGYVRIEKFGHYRCDPLSVSYGKDL
jgi:GNAT superfamily N-acetyltransferase